MRYLHKPGELRTFENKDATQRYDKHSFHVSVYRPHDVYLRKSNLWTPHKKWSHSCTVGVCDHRGAADSIRQAVPVLQHWLESSWIHHVIHWCAILEAFQGKIQVEGTLLTLYALQFIFELTSSHASPNYSLENFWRFVTCGFMHGFTMTRWPTVFHWVAPANHLKP